ncbi:J domain-containing protein [Acidithiobacillus ferrivorans]|nr:J domain-containing protein [Acidithiobacillus ferrivorans]
MDIIEAAEILNVRHDADHLVVKAAYHALAKRHHPDHGGDTDVMQRVNDAHNYMSTRSQAARLAEWERLQPKPQQPPRPSGKVGQFDEACAREAARKASSPNPTPPSAGPTTKPWKPALTTRQKFEIWRYRQPRIVRWLLILSRFLLILIGRLAVVAAMFYGYAEAVRWSIASLAHGWYALLIIFPGIMVVLAGLMVTVIIAMNFLHGGWKGLSDFLNDRGHEGLTVPSDAWTRKTTRTSGRTRWI